MTTKAMDDAAKRISRYLLMHLVTNAGCGLVLGTGLFLIGLDHAFLWGVLGGAFRYLPYVGPFIAGVPAVLVSLAMFPGWFQPLLVAGLFVALEVIVANVVEPRLYGRSMGVSEVGLLVVAAFWAFLWGPIGLLLSNPMTVCLVVIGKYVPQLEFLSILLGDEEPLSPEVAFYQRIVARDQDEATELAAGHASVGVEQVYDELLIPALNFAKRDLERGHLELTDAQSILHAAREIIDDLGSRNASEPVAAAEPASANGHNGNAVSPAAAQVRLVACPCHGELDALALELLSQVLDSNRWDVQILSIELLAAELAESVGKIDPPVVLVGALSPGSLARTRHLCKRLRARLPNARIVVGRWGPTAEKHDADKSLEEAGADHVETTLQGVRIHLNSWLPAFQERAATRDGAARV
jgi:hypothetical protein